MLVTENCLRVQVYVKIQEFYEKLEKQKEQIESVLGPLNWKPNPEKKTKVIYIERDADLENESQWPEYASWMAEQIGKFREVFMPLVMNL